MATAVWAVYLVLCTICLRERTENMFQQYLCPVYIWRTFNARSTFGVHSPA